MNSRMFKFFHGHVITNRNVFVSDGLIELLPSQIFTFKKSHGGGVGRLRCINTKTSRRSVSSRFGCRGRVVKNHNRAGLCWRVNLLVFVASTTRKVPSIHSLGHRYLPFQRSMRDDLHCGWNWRMRLVNLHLNLVPSNTFPFVLLHGCHSKKKGGRGKKRGGLVFGRLKHKK